MDNITFSDSDETSDQISNAEISATLFLSIEDFCSRHPESPECLEYDL